MLRFYDRGLTDFIIVVLVVVAMVNARVELEVDRALCCKIAATKPIISMCVPRLCVLQGKCVLGSRLFATTQTTLMALTY